jgi:phosphate/sulfate permease
MDWIVWMLFVVPVGGLVIAYFEYKGKKTFLMHDNNRYKKGFWLKQRIEKQADPFKVDKW